MATSFSTKCPYCGISNSLMYDPMALVGRDIVCCETTDGGCDRYYVVFWRTSVRWDVKVIEGQKEMRGSLSSDFSELSIRTQNCLRNEGMQTWDDVIKADRSAWEWLRSPNFGRKALNELKLELQMRGVALRDK